MYDLNDAFLADSAEVAGSGRLPVYRHVQLNFAGENGGIGLGFVVPLAGSADRVRGPSCSCVNETSPKVKSMDGQTAVQLPSP